jgi:hypothetical protein
MVAAGAAGMQLCEKSSRGGTGGVVIGGTLTAIV